MSCPRCMEVSGLCSDCEMFLLGGVMADELKEEGRPQPKPDEDDDEDEEYLDFEDDDNYDQPDFVEGDV